MADGDTQPRQRGHLRLIGEATQEVPPLVDDLPEVVRVSRRSMARLLRALQASGRSVANWPRDVTTRLAHVDVVTARYLLDPTSASEATIRDAMTALRALEQWVLERLTKVERARVRAFELMIRIEDNDLHAPLLCPDGAPEDQHPALEFGGARPQSLRSGIRELGDQELIVVCHRLGVRPLALESEDPVQVEPCDAERTCLEDAVVETLRDDHLVRILVATLPPETHELLAALVRDEVPDAVLRRLASEADQTVVRVATPSQQLRACGLAFRSGGHGQQRLWVPVELHNRLDGVLRAYGF